MAAYSSGSGTQWGGYLKRAVSCGVQMYVWGCHGRSENSPPRERCWVWTAACPLLQCVSHGKAGTPAYEFQLYMDGKLKLQA